MGADLFRAGFSARVLRVFVFFVLLAIGSSVLAGRSDAPAERTGDAAYASPVATPVMAVATFATAKPPVMAEESVVRPAAPSSLALLAVGLTFLFIVRSRHWVR